jgi:hypothetical protein
MWSVTQIPVTSPMALAAPRHIAGAALPMAMTVVGPSVRAEMASRVSLSGSIESSAEAKKASSVCLRDWVSTGRFWQ